MPVVGEGIGVGLAVAFGAATDVEVVVGLRVGAALVVIVAVGTGVGVVVIVAVGTGAGVVVIEAVVTRARLAMAAEVGVGVGAAVALGVGDGIGRSHAAARTGSRMRHTPTNRATSGAAAFGRRAVNGRRGVVEPARRRRCKIRLAPREHPAQSELASAFDLPLTDIFMTALSLALPEYLEGQTRL